MQCHQPYLNVHSNSTSGTDTCRGSRPVRFRARVPTVPRPVPLCRPSPSSTHRPTIYIRKTNTELSAPPYLRPSPTSSDLLANFPHRGASTPPPPSRLEHLDFRGTVSTEAASLHHPTVVGFPLNVLARPCRAEQQVDCFGRSRRRPVGPTDRPTDGRTESP
jgi:hypothetical protein